jgi:hypothetical protein
MTSLVTIGIALGSLGSIAINTGNNLQSLGMAQLEMKDHEEARDSCSIATKYQLEAHQAGPIPCAAAPRFRIAAGEMYSRGVIRVARCLWGLSAAGTLGCVRLFRKARTASFDEAWRIVCAYTWWGVPTPLCAGRSGSRRSDEARRRTAAAAQRH